MTPKTIEEKYKKLDDRDHALLRPGRYLGSIKHHTALTWMYDENINKMVKKELTWNPGLLKIVDEIISNSVDEFKRKGSHLTTIKIDIDKEIGEFKIWDDGGIPVVLHREYEEYVPEMIFKHLKAGSNFDDNEASEGTGQNGEGAALTNIFSTKFVIKTADGKNQFKQIFENNLHKINPPSIKPSSKNFTEIKFIPDYKRLETSLEGGNYLKIIKRIYDIAGCNPKLKIYLNSKRISISSFKHYINLFTDEFIFEETDKWRIGIASASDGFEHISFVNGENTMIGGTHIEYIANQITTKLRIYFNKKHKVDVKPANIKNHMTLFIDGTIINPRYSSQTKDELITEPRDYKTSYNISDKCIKKIISSPIIQDVLDWVEAKRLQQEQAKIRDHQKKINKKKIPKLMDANGSDRDKCILFITEGDSASANAAPVRNINTHAFLPLKGKVLNVSEIKDSKIVGNQEIQDIMNAIGLKLHKPAKDLRYGKICILTDADPDGAHISSLLINFFYKFWPELFNDNKICLLNAPLYIAEKNNKKTYLYNEQEYQDKDWVGYKVSYFKGLGGLEEEDWNYFLNINPKFINILESEDDISAETLEMAFGADSNKRKTWMSN